MSAMQSSCGKYRPIPPINLPDRRWPGNTLTKAPIWCSVDLRDGNQALVNPMDLHEKLTMFQALVDAGFKEIEVGFPAASQTEYDILRVLIDGGHIPDDVTIQVLVQAREHLIQKTFEAIRGAKNVIVHFYNSTSELQRRVVFRTDRTSIADIAVSGARLIRELAERQAEHGTNIRFEYSPESFSGTEPDFAVEVCARVAEALGASPERPVILNLPSTVQLSSPNSFADQVEYFCRSLPCRQSAIVSVHPHNDRGTGIADAELALLAGAERVEGTLFGNGERTGNVDLVTLALNMHTQGIDCGLKLGNLNLLRDIYESCTHMEVPPRWPYAGDLVFTAFSGSHQDAISKGIAYMNDTHSDIWSVPYLPIDPADIGRQYEPVIRINSQSGKGGAVYVLQTMFGYHLPKKMHPEFGQMVKAECDRLGRELQPEEILTLFRVKYLDVHEPYALIKHRIHQESGINGDSVVHFEGDILFHDKVVPVCGDGNGPIDAFFHALHPLGIHRYQFVSYHEHALSQGSDSKALAYIHLKAPDGRDAFGVGMADNINIASICGVLCAINRCEAGS